MVETVSAQSPVLGQGTSVAAVRLEPGTELRARVEANLPGGVVRLATDDAKFDLKLPVRLPPGSDVIVSVSGNKANPVIQVTTQQVLPGQPVVPVAAQQPEQAPPPSQVPAGRPVPGQGQAQAPVRAQGGAVLPAVTQPAHAAQTRQAVQAAPVPPAATAASRPSVQDPPARQGTDPGRADVQQAAGPARQSGPQTATAPQVAPSAAREAIQGAKPDPVAAATRPQQSGGSASPPLSTAGRSGVSAPAPPAAPAQGNAGTGGRTAAPVPIATTSSNQTQVPSSPVLSSAPVTASPPVTPGSQTNPQQTGATVGQAQSPSPANPASATASALPQPGEAISRPATPPLQTTAGPAVKAETLQQAPQQPGRPATAAAGAAATTASAPTGPVPNSARAPVAPSSTTSAPVTAQSAEPVRALAGSPLPGADRATPAPAALSGSGVSSAKPGVGAGSVTPSPVRPPANGTPNVASAPANPTPQSKALPQIGESLRVAHNQPYRASASGPVLGTTGNSTPNVTTEANPAGQLARQAFQALGEQQSGLGNLFSQVGNLMSAQAAGKVSLPDPVAKAMQQILGLRLNPAQNLSADDIQQSLRMSGQFREANAAVPRQGAPAGQADLKTVLLSFRALLQQFGAEAQLTRPAAQPKAPSRQEAPQAQAQAGGRGFLPGTTPQILQAVLKETDAALARVRMTQLVNTGLAGDDRAQATSRPMDLVFELPLALGQETGILQLQVGRDGSGQAEDGDNEPAWRLRFAMDLTATGPVEAAVSLRGGGTYVRLWVERSATFDGLKALEETMMASFADAGLDLQEFRLVRGLPPKAAAKYGTLVDRQS